MKTEIFKDNYLNAAQILKNGGLVAVPTETVYGLAGNGLDANIIEKIYEVKGRPAYKPISLMVSGVADIDKYTVNVSKQAVKLAERFWPGPLTIILLASDIIPKNLLAGGNTVGLRCPASLQTLDLLKSLSFPLAVPSANISGEPSPKNADEVISSLGGLIDGVIDGGPCGLGFESTIFDMSSTPYKIIRHGSLPDEEVYSALEESIKIVGITGCSGAGKTSALHIYEDAGYSVIDCDKLYHILLDENTDMCCELNACFPSAFINGTLDRKLLADIVFSDAERLSVLNSVTHKYVINAVKYFVRVSALNGVSGIAIDAVELFSSGLNEICDYTVAVLADMDIRLKRLIDRDSITKSEAIMRINAQKDEDYYIRSADYSLYNNLDKFTLRNNILGIINKEKAYE